MDIKERYFMLIRRSIFSRIAVIGCCLSLTGCWGSKPTKKSHTTTQSVYPIVDDSRAGDSFQTESRETSLHIPNEYTIYYFNLNSALLSNKAKAALNHVADYLREHPSISIVLDGHADARGSEKFNEFLAKCRANSVKDYLKQQDIPHVQIETYGHGNRKLAVAGNTEEAHAKNRRVELKYH